MCTVRGEQNYTVNQSNVTEKKKEFEAKMRVSCRDQSNTNKNTSTAEQLSFKKILDGFLRPLDRRFLAHRALVGRYFNTETNL